MISRLANLRKMTHVAIRASLQTRGVLLAFDKTTQKGFAAARGHNRGLILNADIQVHPSVRYIHLTPHLFEDIDVKTPEFPDSISEGDVKWLKKTGDAVKSEEIVLEIETEKTAIPVPAPADGVVVEQYVKQDQVIGPGTKLFKLKVEPKK